ncbi:hypothetical protein FRC14_003216 [Serendipita sp. 396]|nr:hypothetical protein FRC14_003216 [Serendipita sp. 396]KAG8784028.1 hypothetical protein FRC15_004150 [Serendipita sp. 397]
MFEVTVAQFGNEAAPDKVEYAILVYLDRKAGHIVKFQTTKTYTEEDDIHRRHRRRRSLEWKPREMLSARQRTTAFRGEVSVGFLPYGDKYLNSMENCLWELESFKGVSKWTSLHWIAEGLERLERSGLAINAPKEEKLFQRLEQVWMEYENKMVMVPRLHSPIKPYYV